MKRILSVILLSFLFVAGNSQQNADYGVYGGISTYFGDINHSKLFYAPLPSAGFFYRYNLHPRQSVKFSLYHGMFSADDADFNNDFQQTRMSSFNGNVTELVSQFEFNFFSYSTMGKRWEFSPYFATGIGVSLFDSQEFSVQPVIPLTIGFKVNIHKNMGLELEHGFRKTFYDNFDGLKDNVSPDDYALLHNNDWYCFSGISFTWKIYNRSVNCATYFDVNGNRKR